MTTWMRDGMILQLLCVITLALILLISKCQPVKLQQEIVSTNTKSLCLKITFIFTSTLETFGDSFMPLENHFRLFYNVNTQDLKSS